MPGFCRNCGSPLGDGQSFCTACGKPLSGAPARPATPAAAPPQAAPPAPRPQAAPQPAAPVAQAAAPSKGGSTLLKVLLGLVIVVVFFAAVGIAGLWYVVHRAKQKVHDLGLDQMSSETARSTEPVLAGGKDPCALLSKEDVSQAVKMTVVRAEAAEGKGTGCTYSVQGEMTDLVAKHASLLQKDASTEQQRQMMESFAKNIFQNANNGQANSNPEHPGESPVFIFKVDNQGAKGIMSMTRLTFGRMAPAFTDLPGIGDEAFDIGGAMILARKGDKILTIMYMMCPCARDDVLPLTKKIADAM